MIDEKPCKCGWFLKIDLSAPVLLTLPPRYKFSCSNCGEVEYIQDIYEHKVAKP